MPPAARSHRQFPRHRALRGNETAQIDIRSGIHKKIGSARLSGRNLLRQQIRRGCTVFDVDSNRADVSLTPPPVRLAGLNVSHGCH